MKIIKTSTILAIAGAMLMAASANAGKVHYKTNVDTATGHPVETQSGDCVITQWDAKGSQCGSLTSEMRTVYFPFNVASLTPAAKAKLNSLSRALKSKSVASVRIIGFADEIGTESYNVRLSQQRANNVATYLRGKGIKVVGKSEVRGLGETASLSDCGDLKGKPLQDCLWRDRRVEVEIVN